MSDRETRALARRFAESLDVADEVALLRARVRDGAISQEGVRIAAGLGHPAAERCLGLSEQFAFDPLERGERLVAELGTSTAERLARVLIALGHGLLAFAGEARELEILRDADKVVLGQSSRSDLERLQSDLATNVYLCADDGCTLGSGFEIGAHRLALAAIALMAQLVKKVGEIRGIPEYYETLSLGAFVAGELEGTSELLADWWADDAEVVGARSRADLGRSLWTALRAELCPWLLGHDDPVSSRCRARSARPLP